MSAVAEHSMNWKTELKGKLNVARTCGLSGDGSFSDLASSQELQQRQGVHSKSVIDFSY
jgi:hypothetical protein